MTIPANLMTAEERTGLDPIGELKLFKHAELWDQGFIDADPLDPVGWSSYTTTGFVSVYHAIYLACIVPYVAQGMVVMEIGPGRGAWTRALLHRGAERVYALDVQSLESNGIVEFLGDMSSRLDYIEVTDFEGRGVPDGAVDFFWSFGTFVHLSKPQQREYAQTISEKLKPGAHGFIQLADVYHWNKVVSSPSFHIHEVLSNHVSGVAGATVRQICSDCPAVVAREMVDESVVDFNVPDPGRYFYVGTEWLAMELRAVGLEVIAASVLPSLRDPVLHFRKRS